VTPKCTGIKHIAHHTHTNLMFFYSHSLTHYLSLSLSFSLSFLSLSTLHTHTLTHISIHFLTLFLIFCYLLFLRRLGDRQKCKYFSGLKRKKIVTPKLQKMFKKNFLIVLDRTFQDVNAMHMWERMQSNVM